MQVHRVVEFDFPFREVVRSALPIADEFLISCHHDEPDGTRAACERLAEQYPQVRIILSDWWKPERSYWCLSDAANEAIEQCRGTYHLALQADEVLHESQLSVVRAIAEQGVYDGALFERLNFWGSFDRVNHNSQRWAREVCRLAKTSLYPKFRSDGDACWLAEPGKGHEGYNILDARGMVQLWHYAYVRSPRALVERQANAARLHGLSPDPRIEASRATGVLDWNGIIPESEFLPLPGTHPAVMDGWIAARRAAVECGRL
jgi:hypothetical protein